jgi:hypothetical protein
VSHALVQVVASIIRKHDVGNALPDGRIREIAEEVVDAVLVPPVSSQHLTGDAPERSGLDRFGTVAFDASVISATIHLRPDGVLVCSRWLTFVPDVYREEAAQIATEVFERFQSACGTRDTLIRFSIALREAIWQRVAPR